MSEHQLDNPGAGALDAFNESVFADWCQAMARNGYGDAPGSQQQFWSLATFQVTAALQKRLAQRDSRSLVTAPDDLVVPLAARLVSECLARSVTLLQIQAALFQLKDVLIASWNRAQLMAQPSERVVHVFFERLALAIVQQWEEQHDQRQAEHQVQQTRMLKYLTDLRLLTWAVGSGLPLPAILEKIVQKVSDYDSWQRCLVGIWESAEKKLQVVVSQRLATEIHNEDEVGSFVWNYVLQERRVILIPDIRTEAYPSQLAAYEPRPYRSLIVFPLYVEDRILGVLGLFHPDANFFTSNEIAPLTPFAQQAAITINIAQNQHMLLQQKRELEFLNRLSRQLDRSLEIQVLVQNLAQAVQRGLRYKRCVIDLWDEEAGRLVHGSSRGLEVLEEICRQSADSALDSGAVTWHRDVTALVPGRAQELDVHGYICVPILLGAMRLGVMHLFTADVHDFSTHEIELLNTVAYQAALTLHNAHLYQQVQKDNKVLHQIAVTDSLTELYNRTYLKDCLQREVARAHRYRQPFTIALFDVDGFKKINDTYGHPVGDKILRHLSSLMCQQFRRPDILARLGGDEFAVLLPECLLPDAERACERFRKKVAGSKLMLPDGEEICVTVSIGVAQLYPGQKVDDLLENADQALYRAKADGKDRVRTYRPA